MIRQPSGIAARQYRRKKLNAHGDPNHRIAIAQFVMDKKWDDG
ncbi:hypothetical protein LTSEALA_3563 [Salmonella enterica subsp. enterica serovar Alachua str. R6-377]|uniref:Uncharacterized protein n=1 Tax=Salmonella enterica subsp. enterica serovar Alachua str. R6-377 TaxID=913241 RepID=G5LRL3_SALET|nr:hypothetical protein LTSEALA_3563 [Salmonella enterica subsp. enterica serovar Alachua str. R6-377]